MTYSLFKPARTNSQDGRRSASQAALIDESTNTPIGAAERQTASPDTFG
jgi:hypothetical protein